MAIQEREDLLEKIEKANERCNLAAIRRADSYEAVSVVTHQLAEAEKECIAAQQENHLAVSEYNRLSMELENIEIKEKASHSCPIQ